MVPEAGRDRARLTHGMTLPAVVQVPGGTMNSTACVMTACRGGLLVTVKF